MSKITITKGQGITLNFDRDQLISVDQTPDGLIFKLQQGIDIMYSHHLMNLQVKNQIISAVNSFDKADVSVDLHNYVKPVKIVVHK